MPKPTQATNLQTTGAQRAASRLNAILSAHPPISSAEPTRQVRRAALRQGKPKRIGTLMPRPVMAGGPGSFERHVITLSKFGDRVERTFHFTKGHRSRRVAA